MKETNINESKPEKSSFIKTLWQMIKFALVGAISTVLLFAVLNTLYLLPPIQKLFDVPFKWWIFNYPVAAKGLGYFISYNVANFAAWINDFILNRKKTFKSSANVAVTLPIYLCINISVLIFDIWFAPKVQEWLLSYSVPNQLAANITTLIMGFMIFVATFPIMKLLFRDRKEEKNEDENEDVETV